MENKDLGNRKINNEQKINEGFSSKNLPDDYNPADANLQPETETDENGNKKTVHRARNPESESDGKGTSEGSQTAIQNEKTVENKDRNSDVASNRYPNSHPDNKKDRGNIKLDEE